jgi:hypothetical protein
MQYQINNRKQRVKSNGSFSEWATVIAGVIQGSVLGPILFLIFIRDLNDNLPENTNIIKYADDLLTYIMLKTIRGDNTRYDQQLGDREPNAPKCEQNKTHVKQQRHQTNSYNQ